MSSPASPCLQLIISTTIGRRSPDDRRTGAGWRLERNILASFFGRVSYMMKNDKQMVNNNDLKKNKLKTDCLFHYFSLMTFRRAPGDTNLAKTHRSSLRNLKASIKLAKALARSSSPSNGAGDETAETVQWLNLMQKTILLSLKNTRT